MEHIVIKCQDGNWYAECVGCGWTSSLVNTEQAALDAGKIHRETYFQHDKSFQHIKKAFLKRFCPICGIGWSDHHYGNTCKMKYAGKGEWVRA